MYSSAGCAALNTFMTTIVATRPNTYPANADWKYLRADGKSHSVMQPRTVYDGRL